MAEAEAGNIPHIEEILAKKAENRPVTPEEYTALTSSWTAWNAASIERKRAEQQAEEERISAARAEIPAAAFTMPLEEAWPQGTRLQHPDRSRLCAPSAI